MEVTSAFLMRGVFKDFLNTFKEVRVERAVSVKDSKSLAVLISKPWFRPFDGVRVETSDLLLFRIDCVCLFNDEKSLREVRISGDVRRRQGDTSIYLPIADIKQTYSDLAGVIDPIRAYLERFGTNVQSVHVFEDGGHNLDPETPKT
eukprot:TRINITY_DN13303_c0_g1_i1.p3 TRINITY_DN13303_c0_g1~~TRINITY_DN13303_c0_g1_i1.p3  ORF type:complete len:147 (+),score=44.21 TRINITY_DN13303_c0_g1_i1:1-441(+)